MDVELTRLLEESKGWWERATPEQRKAMQKAQRESWARAFAPCEHGDYDWETCAQCRTPTTQEPDNG